MLKYPVTILLLLLLGVQTFSKWCLIAEFQINRDFIAKNLCVNRARPACCCHGKCYLNKKMAADESGQQSPEKSGSREESVFQLHAFDYSLPKRVVVDLSILHHTPYRDDLSQDPVFALDQPPQAWDSFHL